MATNYQFSLGSDTYSNEFTHTSYGGVTYKAMGIDISQYNSHYLKWKYANSSNPEIEVMTPNAPDKIGQVNTNTPAPSGCYGYRKIHTTPQFEHAIATLGNANRSTANGADTRFIYVPWNKMYTKGISTPEQFNARGKHPVKYSVIVEEKQANGNWAVAGTSAETCLGMTNSVGVQITDWAWKTDGVGTTLAKYLNGTIKKDPTLRDLRYRIIVDPDGEWGLARETTRYFYQPQISTYFTYENYYRNIHEGMRLANENNYGSNPPTTYDNNAPYTRYMLGSPLNTIYNNGNNHTWKLYNIISIGVWLDASQWDSTPHPVIEFTFPFHRGASGWQIKMWDTNRVSTYPDYAFGTDDEYGNVASNDYGWYPISSINLQRDRLKAWYINNVNPNTGVVIVDETTPNYWKRQGGATSSSFAKHYLGFYNMGTWVNEAPWQGLPRPNKNWSNALHCYTHLPCEYNPANQYLPNSSWDTAYNYSTYSTAEKAHINAPMLPSNTSSNVNYANHSEAPRYADASHSSDYNWQRDNMYPSWV